MNKFWKYALFSLVVWVLLVIAIFLKQAPYGGYVTWLAHTSFLFSTPIEFFAVVLSLLIPFLATLKFAQEYHDEQARGLYYKLPFMAVLTTIGTLIPASFLLRFAEARFPSGSQGAWIFYTLYVVLGYIPFIIIFSIITAVIVQKSYTSPAVSWFYNALPKITRICLIILTVLVLIYFVLEVTDYYSCGTMMHLNGYKADHECLAQKAFEQNNPVVCEKSIDPSFRDYCYRELAKLKNDKTFCDTIKDAYNKEQCLSLFSS